MARARKESLLRLHERLIAKRDALRQKLDEEMTHVGVGAPGGDVVDAANEDASSELSTQLAALETEELWQIERAIRMIRDGRYGLCESCDEAIPVERLKALPFTTTCVKCQLKSERRGGGASDDYDWASAYEHEGKMSDREITLGDIDIEIEY